MMHYNQDKWASGFWLSAEVRALLYKLIPSTQLPPPISYSAESAWADFTLVLPFHTSHSILAIYTQIA